jgi:hypothetical protein
VLRFGVLLAALPVVLAAVPVVALMTVARRHISARLGQPGGRVRRSQATMAVERRRVPRSERISLELVCVSLGIALTLAWIVALTLLAGRLLSTTF